MNSVPKSGEHRDAAEVPATLSGSTIMQVGILVSDLDSALALHSQQWGIGQWRCYTYGPDNVPELTYRGGPGDFVMRFALGGSNPEVELIESLAGPSIYEEWLAERGPGLHHLAYTVEDIDNAIAAMAECGYELIQSGRGFGLHGDGAFAYFETVEQFGYVVEARELPSARRPPESVWPAPVMRGS